MIPIPPPRLPSPSPKAGQWGTSGAGELNPGKSSGCPVGPQVTSTISLPRTGCSPTSWRCWFSCRPTPSPRSPSSLSGRCLSGPSTPQTPTTASMSGGGPSPAAPALLGEECGEHGSRNWGRSVGSTAHRVSVCFSAAHLCSAHSCPVWWQPNLGTGKRAPSSTACKCEPGCWCPGGTCTEDWAPAGRPGVRGCACKVMSRLALSYFKPQYY